MVRVVSGLLYLRLLKLLTYASDMQYNLVYAEEAPIPTTKAWTLRQVGVFCRYTPKPSGNIWIFLNAKEGSIIQNRIEDGMNKWELNNAYPQSLFSLHLLVFSSYFRNWRFYLSDLNQELEDIADIALTREFTKSSHYTEGYDQLRKLKHLEDKVLPLTARFRTILGTVLALRDVNELFRNAGFWQGKDYLDVSNELKCYETHINGHLETVTLMEKRVKEILNLVRVAMKRLAIYY